MVIFLSIDETKLRQKAKDLAESYLKYDSEYRMGTIAAERPNEKTRKLSQTYQNSCSDGVRMLFSVDDDMATRAAKTLEGEIYKDFADSIRNTLKNGGKVIFSGCGSTGRICMRLESSWRQAIDDLSKLYPKAKEELFKLNDKVGHIQTGGDYAIIRAVESFEDSTDIGREQAREWKLKKGDLLVGITATGETTSILGTAIQALDDGAVVYMLVCTDPEPLKTKMERCRVVYTHKNCKYVCLPCGPFALTGSSRMQSSTFEQLCCVVALECALYDVLLSCGVNVEAKDYGFYGRQFKNMTEQLLKEECVSVLKKATLKEQSIYENKSLITLFADDCLMDVLTDTVERSPTFMTPPFCSLDMVSQEPSWAFVKNPACDTKTAWLKCFCHIPRCIEWDLDKYRELRFTEEQVVKITDISLNALYRFQIGNEPDVNREQIKGSHALWVGISSAPDVFKVHAKRYETFDELTIEKVGIKLQTTFMDMFEHLCIKLMLNTLSTGVMARMGRITGNWMTCLAMSNKKLIDRSARIVSDVCSVPYEKALEENFYSKLLSEEKGLNLSPCEETIKRLKG